MARPPSSPRLAAAAGAALVLALGLVTGCPFHKEIFQRLCSTDADCSDGIECTQDVCNNGVCSNPVSPAETMCSKGVCDGNMMNPTCVECLVSNPDCTMFHSTLPICDQKTHTCVSCSDGVKNGEETEVDCGGPDCGACQGNACKDTDAGAACGNGTVCDTKEDVCCATPCDPTVTPCVTCSMKHGAMADGTCGQVPFGQDPFMQCGNTGMATAGGCGDTMGKCACEDGVKNGKETDTDCGGGTCPGCLGGKHCAQMSDCDANFGNCVNEVCCNTPCGATCYTCNSAGMCVAQPVGFPDPTCPADQACAPVGTATPNCIGKAGASCTSNGKCLSGSCLAGACAKGGPGKPCSGNTDCTSGNCQSYVCM